MKIVKNETIVKSYKKIMNINEIDQSKIADDIFKFQPVFLSTFLALQKDIQDPNKLGNLFMLMNIIWLSISEFKEIKEKKITEDMFEEYINKNISFIKYTELEKDENNLDKMFKLYLDNYNQKFLLNLLFLEIFSDEGKKYNFSLYMKGKLINYLKSLIDCIDFLLNEKYNKN